MFGIGSTELLLILIVALLVLGPKSLASTARSVGKVVGQFRRVSTDFQRTLNAEVAMEEEKEKREKAAREVEAGVQQPAASAETKPGVHTAGQAGAQPGSQEGSQTAAATAATGATAAAPDNATATAKAASDANDEDDTLSPPPGSPLDEALKKAAAEAANAAELMEPVTVETPQPVQSVQSDQPAQATSVAQTTPASDAQGQQTAQNRV